MRSVTSGLFVIAAASFSLMAAVQQPGAGPGPWDNDIHVYRVSRDGSAERLAVFLPEVGQLIWFRAHD